MPPPRIAVGLLSQETNSFSPIPTVLDTFEQCLFLRGDEVLYREFKAISIEVPGFLSVLRDAGAVPLPLIATEAGAAGPLTRATFDTLVAELEARLVAMGRIDGLLLALHGALMVEGDTGGGDAEIIERMRAILGLDVPIGIAFDLHAHITPRMLQPNCFHIGYQTYPHTDIYETGQRAARLMLDTIAGRRHPVMALVKRPMVLSASSARTTDGPLVPVVEAARRAEAAGRVLHASLFPVQPWLDVPDLGFAALVCTDADAAEARAVATELADMAWDRRHDFDAGLVSLDDAIRTGLASSGLTVVGDAGDSPSGGAAADSAAVLRALLTAQADRAERLTYLTLCDPPAAAMAHGAGTGSVVKLSLGHHFSVTDGKPVACSGVVTHLSDGDYHMRDQELFARMGACAVIGIGSLRLLVRSFPALEWDSEMYFSVGLDPCAAALVFVKSPGGFRHSFVKLADRILMADTPGPTCANMRKVPFSRVTRPLFPLDDI
jgi:microcystin degradation protein MlrC